MSRVVLSDAIIYSSILVCLECAWYVFMCCKNKYSGLKPWKVQVGIK